MADSLAGCREMLRPRTERYGRTLTVDYLYSVCGSVGRGQWSATIAIGSVRGGHASDGPRGRTSGPRSSESAPGSGVVRDLFGHRDARCCGRDAAEPPIRVSATGSREAGVGRTGAARGLGTTRCSGESALRPGRVVKIDAKLRRTAARGRGDRDGRPRRRRARLECQFPGPQVKDVGAMRPVRAS